ncbi:MAG: PAS domain S-box protein [bacterium]|nr:PAS domain S-box protein [bacterium]
MKKKVKELIVDKAEHKQPEEIIVSSIIDNTLVGVFKSSKRGKVLFMNKPLLKMLEYKSIEEINKRGGARILYKNPKERDEIVSLLNKKHYVEGNEVEFVSKTGKEIFTYLCMRIEGDVVSGTIVDITDRRQIEEALKESEERFRNTFEQAVVGMSHVGLDGKWIFINQKYCDIVGYTHDELVKKTFKDITHPDDINIDYENFKRLISKKIDHYKRDKRYICKDGSIVWVDLTVSAIHDSSGSIKYLVAVIEDITSRKQIEDEISKASKFPFENPNPVLRMNEKGEILYKNPATLKLLKKIGFSEKDIFNILPNNIINMVNKAFKNKTTISDLETVVGNKIYSYTLKPILDQKYINLYGADITERKKIEIMKENAFREVSHELKTPIAMIKMAQDINQQAIKNNDMNKIMKTQEIISNNLKRLSEDVNNILATFVLKRKKGLNKIIFSVKKLIEEILKNNQYILYEKKLRFKIDIKKEAENIFADPLEIKILLNNIIDNAIKFTEKGFITVSVSLAGEFIKIEVKDTGCGISPEIKENIFTRYFKRHPAVPGTGLGLTISKEIVEMHNGKIEVFSKGIGKGTIVTVYLPVKDRKES